MTTLRNKFIMQMQMKGYSNSSIRSYTAAIIALANFYKTSPDLLSTEQIRQYIYQRLTEKKLPVVLAREEVKKLIDVTINLKHRAILTLTYSAGLRLSEVCNLKITDIDSKRMLIRIVQSKGFQARYCVLSPVALDVLRQYWSLYRPTDRLFQTSALQGILNALGSISSTNNE